MLRQRIVTALVLLALLVPTLAIRSAWPFAILTLAAMALAGWEWARLNGGGAFAVSYGIVVGICCALALAAGWSESAPPVAWWIALGLWVLGGAWMLRGGVAAWLRLARAVRLAIGLVVLWTAWLAMANAKAHGLNFILSIFAVVWTADIFAYFGGRTLGRHKLAPAISPGKSWEGVWSGMLGALLVAAAWLALDSTGRLGSASIFGLVATHFGYAGLALVVVFIVAMSIVGDLFESLVKRSAGAKDSSGLLPGHGGILDRLDALLPVFPIALAIASR